jgi:hypothetical protein
MAERESSRFPLLPVRAKSVHMTEKMPKKPPDIATRIMESIVRMPPKPHEDMKLGTHKRPTPTKERPASKGRVHKGKSHA